MPDFTTPVLPADVTQPSGLLATLLTMSLTAVALLRPVYDADDDGGTIRDFTWVYLNPAGQRMLGQPERPASLLTLFPGASGHADFEAYCQAFVTGQPQHRQTNYQADGVDGYFRTVAQRYDELLVINFTDTNEESRSAVEVALRETQADEQAARSEAERQRQRFYDVLMQLPAHVAVHEGPDQVFTLVNPGYQGLAPGRDLLGQPIRESWPELVSQGILDVLDGVYHTGEPFVGREVSLRVDFTRTGKLEQIYLNAFFLPLRDVRGQVRGVLDFSYDVTEQVEARQQLQALNEKLEARVEERTRETLALQAELLAAAQAQAREREAFYHIFEQTPALVALLREPGHRFAYVNPAFQALFPGRQLLGLEAAGAAPELLPEGFAALLNGVYQTGETCFGQEQPVALPPALGQVPRPRYFNFTYQAYREQGAIVGVSLFAFDVTDQVLARRQVQTLNQELTDTNQELHASNRQLTRTNADLDSFIYTASHDLKAPIANIEGLVLALRDELAAPAPNAADLAHMFGLIDQSIARFQQTIGHLTGIMQLQHPGSQPPAHTDLAPLLEGVRLDLAGSLEASRAQLLVDVAACPTLRLPPKDVRSILYNLLSNALKYRHPGRPPVVRVHTRCDAHGTELRVQDNGLGLSEAQQARLFELFRRLHTHVEGSGVGLYSIRKLIENAGGTIRVESTEGVGSTFIVQLPA